MTASEGFLSTMVTGALALTIVAPITLIILLIVDWKKGRLW